MNRRTRGRLLIGQREVRNIGTSTCHTFTVLGTTDLHGHAICWDYDRDRPYRDDWGNRVGLARVATVVGRERTASHAPLLIDAGDTLQGTPLAQHFAVDAPIGEGRPHPMATAMNAIGYDSAAVGNHEFNFGVDVLRVFESQLDFPLLAANATDEQTGSPAFTPYVIRPVEVPIGRPVRVGILGLTNPGTALWDRSLVEGRMSFDSLIDSAAHWVPRMRDAGADVVVVASHAGPDAHSSYGDALPYEENASSLVAEQVPGIDAILAGHVHRELVCRTVHNHVTGEPVVLTQPLCWGMRVSAIDITVAADGDGYDVVGRDARLLDTRDVDEDPAIVRLVEAEHREVVEAGRRVVGRSTQAMDSFGAQWRPIPLMGLVQHTQAVAVAEALSGGADRLPVLSIATMVGHAAAIPRGDVTLRDVDAVCTFDNELVAVRMTGAQVRRHLEVSAEYYRTLSCPGPARPGEILNAETEAHPTGTPDYSYDAIAGHDASLRYDIDLARLPGSRIVSLTYDGRPLDDEAEFAVAMSGYRRSGAGAYPAVASAPLLYDRGTSTRTLLIDAIARHSPLSPQAFDSDHWRLTFGGETLKILDGRHDGCA